MPKMINPADRDQLRSINNSNPFVMILRERTLFYRAATIDLIRKLVINLVILIMLNILSNIIFRNMWIFTVVSLTMYLLVSFYSWGIIRKSHSTQFYNMVYSEEFNSIYINEENISKITEDVNMDIGKIESIMERISLDNIVLVILYGILILIN